MERTLFIVRHGKSSWDYEDLDDVFRPLSERGIQAAETMAQRLHARAVVPQLIFSSPATRALHTALIMQRIWRLPPSALHIHEEIYMAYTEDLSLIVGKAPDELSGLAIFGHNPAFTMYANLFLDRPLDNLPTAGVVVVTLESESWKDLSRDQVIRTLVDTPKKKA